MRWSGLPGGAGLTVMYSQIGPIITLINGLFSSLAPNLPNDVSFTFPTDGDIVDSATGALTGAWHDPTVFAPMSGTNAFTWTASNGFAIRWNTATIVNRRRVQGRTFFVPSTHQIWDTSGNFVGASVTSIQAAVNAFLGVASTRFVIWHRPVAEAGGEFAPVTSGALIPKPVVLTNRRD